MQVNDSGNRITCIDPLGRKGRTGGKGGKGGKETLTGRKRVKSRGNEDREGNNDREEGTKMRWEDTGGVSQGDIAVRSRQSFSSVKYMKKMHI